MYDGMLFYMFYLIFNTGKSMELHEVKMVNPNVFMGMDVVKRFLLFLQEQINPSTCQHNSKIVFTGDLFLLIETLTLR